MSSRTAIILSTIVGLLFACSSLFAGSPPPPPPPPLGIPIDGGATFLLGAAAAVGGKALYQKYKASKASSTVEE